MMLPPSLQPYAKAVSPFMLTLIAVAGQWAITGTFDRAEAATAITGALSSLVTLLVPNAERASLDFSPPELSGEEVEG